MIKQKTVYNFFKFLENKRGEKFSFNLKRRKFTNMLEKEEVRNNVSSLVFKLIYEPQRVTKEDLHVKGDLSLSFFNIKELPNNLIVDGDLLMLQSKIKRLPDDIKIGRSIFAGMSNLEYLPDNLVVGETLETSYCPIKKLPRNLNVGYSLSLVGSEIEEIPDNLQVTKNLFCDNTPLAEKYTRSEIRKIIEDKGGFVNGSISC